MPRLVLKFGRNTISDAQQVIDAANLVVQAVQDGHEVIVVTAAMGQTSDQLMSFADEIGDNQHSARERDLLLSTGEQMAAALLSMAIQSLGFPSRSFTGAQAGIITEGSYGSSKIREIDTNAISACLMREEVPVVAGAQGVLDNREIATLGCTGSDTTAIAIAIALGADRVIVYSDVDGVYTADPKLVHDATKQISLTHDEMLELTSVGAGLLNPRALELAAAAKLPIVIRSALNPELPGTVISSKESDDECHICSVVCDLNQTAVGLISEEPSIDEDALMAVGSLFSRLEELDVRADMLMLLAHEDRPGSEICFTVDKRKLGKVQPVVNSYLKAIGNPDVRYDLDVAKISVVGQGLANQPGIVTAIFETLHFASIPVQMVASTEMRVSVITLARHAADAVRLIHDRLDLTSLDDLNDDWARAC